MMDSNPTERGAKPRTNRNNHQQQQQRGGHQSHRVVRKVPPRAASDRRNIYITSKTDFKAQLKRCEDLLNAGAKEIYLHCMGFSITRGLNLALRLVQNSEGALSYAINTSTIKLVDELHPLCDEEDIGFRQRNNSALHIKIFNRSLFDIVVPKLPAQPALPTPDHSEQKKQTQQQH
ncbi:hypothetical protein KR222_002415, partial [Zaprionus bogoriensis]